jgi:hypothetical protein
MLTYGNEAWSVCKQDDGRNTTSEMKFMRKQQAILLWIIKKFKDKPNDGIKYITNYGTLRKLQAYLEKIYLSKGPPKNLIPHSPLPFKRTKIFGKIL